MKRFIHSIGSCYAVVALMALVAPTPAGSGGGSGKLIGVAMPTKSLQRWNQDGANMKELHGESRYT